MNVHNSTCETIFAMTLCWLGRRRMHSAIPDADDYGFLDMRHHAFRSLMADPREIQLSLRAILSPSPHKAKKGEVAAGLYFSLFT